VTVQHHRKIHKYFILLSMPKLVNVHTCFVNAMHPPVFIVNLHRVVYVWSINNTVKA
jgi:hypothetical protein